MLTTDFDDLYQKHFAEIYRHCYRFARNKEDAEELSNEALVRAYFHRNQFDSQKGNFRTWIFTIATNLALDFIHSATRKRKNQTNSIDDLLDLPNGDPQPDEYSAHEQLLKFIEECLKLLNKKERLAITLRHLQDFTLQETARIIGMKSPNSAKKQIKIGEQKMKKCLEKKGIDDNYWHGA